MARIAFYAPIKPPDHAIASGDRQIALLLIKALELAGHSVELASRHISYSKKSALDILADKKQAAMDEAARLVIDWRARPAVERPALWLTYHPYCKSPDWIGPRLCQEFDLPYATIEACRTHQGRNDEWRPWRDIVTASVRSAAMNFWLTATDQAYLRSILPDAATMAPLLPFVDLQALGEVPAHPLPASFDPNLPTLIAVAMMRPGAKARSYALLADALERIDGHRFNLLVTGDGPIRAEVEAAFSFLPERQVHFAGALDHDQAIGAMKSADLFVWPGYREAIGMVYLEAQAVGLPVVALRTAGTPEALVHGQTGLLTDPDSDQHDGVAGALAEAMAALLDSRSLRQTMGQAGVDYIGRYRDIGAAAGVLAAVLDPLVARSANSAR